jgi:hypothetical protein
VVVTYTVVRSVTGLTETELNALTNLDLLAVIEEDVGYQYIFYTVAADVTYKVAYSYSGLSETELQDDYGDDDYQLITTIRMGVGIQYIFKDVS